MSNTRSEHRHFRRFSALFVFVFLILSVVFPRQPKFAGKALVKPGIDVLRSRGFDILKGKRVGLITNPTGVSADLEQTVDILHSAPGVKLVALFGPEHGVRGDAEGGKIVDSFNDSQTGLPVYSLYGRTRKPTKDMLRGIDVLVYDIQDIGVRSYTYISTLGLAMEAAAENNVTFVVLDRPNPLTGVRVEGSMLELNYKSFIGAYRIPYVYGMTAGELAEMINMEGWLDKGVKCKLVVVPMEGWKRSMWWDETGLPWVPTSPHIPHASTPLFYVMTGLLGELGTANQGVGYTMPFELVGASWVNGDKLADDLNSRGLSGVRFRPLSYRPFYFDTGDSRFLGVQIHVTDREKLNMTAVQISVIDALQRVFPEKNIFARAKPDRIGSFDKAMGSDRMRKMFQSRKSVEEILREIDREKAPFMVERQKYLLYD
ncbi:MAG: DUF1343 domain-containing protein [Ignavibacteriales bacterium]|nr:DUF1343 domain-containing protein [Ignavibacteriales bacterium]